MNPFANPRQNVWEQRGVVQRGSLLSKSSDDLESHICMKTVFYFFLHFPTAFIFLMRTQSRLLYLTAKHPE
jgi:hypothetical protein